MAIGSFLLGNTLGREEGEKAAEAAKKAARTAQKDAEDYREIAITLKKQLAAERQKNKIEHKRFLIERRERDGLMVSSYAKTRAMREFVEKGVLDRNEINAAVHKWEASPEIAEWVQKETERLNPILEEEANR